MYFFNCVLVFIVILQGVEGAGLSLSRQIISTVQNRIKSQCFNGLQAANSKIYENGCPPTFDTVWQCWPSAKVNTTLRQICNPLIYKEAILERKCLPGGKWESTRSYRKFCRILKPNEIRKNRNDLILRMFDPSKTDQIIKEFKRLDDRRKHKHIYVNLGIYLRYVDIAVCSFSLVLIFCFVSPKDHRFILHKFLILSFILMEPFYIVVRAYYHTRISDQRECSIIWTFEMYFKLVQICMMFSEGFYQFRQFYFVFVTESKVRSYIIFSYTIPAVVVFGMFWPAMYFGHPKGREHVFYVCWTWYYNYKYAYILYTPMFLLLFLNLLITIYMMNLIITKLKQEKSSESAKARKAARGFLVLIVLLGFAYMITLYGPKDNVPYEYMKNILQPMQGVMVCLLQVIFSNQIIKGYKRFTRRFTRKMTVERQFSEQYGKRRSSSIASRGSSVGGGESSGHGSIQNLATITKNENLQGGSSVQKAERKNNLLDVYHMYKPPQTNKAFDLDDFQEFTSFEQQQQQQQQQQPSQQDQQQGSSITITM